MTAYKWRRIEPGYYELLRKDESLGRWIVSGWTIANMQGQSVLWSGIQLQRWRVRLRDQDITGFWTKAEAQAYVLDHQL